MILSIPTMWLFPDLFLMFLPQTNHKQTFKIAHILSPRPLHIILVRACRHGGRNTAINNAYFPRTPG